jgi:hypothetical protein
MPDYSTNIAIAVVILVAAIPYVARIRDPRQKFLAAYFIFMSSFAAAAAVLFTLLGRLASQLELGPSLEQAGPAVLFLLLVFLPALTLATWLARKPPWRRGPPD